MFSFSVFCIVRTCVYYIYFGGGRFGGVGGFFFGLRFFVFIDVYGMDLFIVVVYEFGYVIGLSYVVVTRFIM